MESNLLHSLTKYKKFFVGIKKIPKKYLIATILNEKEQKKMIDT